MIDGLGWVVGGLVYLSIKVCDEMVHKGQPLDSRQDVGEHRR